MSDKRGKCVDIAVSDNCVLIIYIHPEDERKFIDELRKLGIEFEVKRIYCG